MHGNQPLDGNDCELEHICMGCNRTPQVLSWGKCGLIAYGGCNSVIIYQTEVMYIYINLTCIKVILRVKHA